MSNKVGEGSGRPKRKAATSVSQESPPYTRSKAEGDQPREQGKLSSQKAIDDVNRPKENVPAEDQQRDGGGSLTTMFPEVPSVDPSETEQTYMLALSELKTREVDWALSLTNIVKCDREILTREAELLGALTALERAKADSNQRLSRHEERLTTLRMKKDVLEKGLVERCLEQRSHQDVKIKHLERMCEEKTARILVLERDLTRNQELVDAEREYRVCQICMITPRNALVLPCMHFLYCSECIHTHQKTSKECPTCRGAISAWIHCKLNVYE